MKTDLLRLARRSENGTRSWSVPDYGNAVVMLPASKSPDGWGTALRWPGTDRRGEEIVREVDLNRHRSIAKNAALELLGKSPRKASRVTKHFGYGKGTGTPWGKADTVITYARGINFYSTPGHGGFKVSAKLNETVPDHLRNADGWYEEDCEWAKVALAFPDLFTDIERRHAEKTLREWHPESWERHYGRNLKEGESLRNDDRLFHEKHAADWVVTSAIGRGEMVKCTATLGGKRQFYGQPPVEERTFLVPSDEYQTRSRFGFVIDPARHQQI